MFLLIGFIVCNRLSDEDDESNSVESDPIPAFGNLQVDDKNANCGAQGKIVLPFKSNLKECRVRGVIGDFFSKGHSRQNCLFSSKQSRTCTVSYPLSSLSIQNEFFSMKVVPLAEFILRMHQRKSKEKNRNWFQLTHR